MTAPRLDSIIHNTLFSFIARGIDVAVTFALAVILARYLGAEGMGQYTYIIAYVAIFVPLVDLGLDHILIREIARARQTADHYIGAALLLKILIAAVTLPLGMAIAYLSGHRGFELWAILLCFLGTLVFREVPTVVGYAAFLAYERMEFRALVTFLFQIVKFACTLPIVFLGWGLAPIFAAALIAEASQGVLALWLVVKRFAKPILEVNPKLWRYYVKESFPIGVAFAFNSLYFQVDILALKHFRTIEETGLFGVPFRIITTLFTLLIPVIWVLLPHLTRAAKESIAKLDEDGQGYLKAIAVLTGGIAVYLMLEAHDLTVGLFGAEFERSAIVLAAISPVVVSHAFLYFFDLTLTAVGKQKLVIIGSAIIFGVKLVADLIFIPGYGIMGAAISTLAADLTCFLVMFNITRRHVTSFRFGAIMIRPAGALLAASLVLYAIRPLPFYFTAPLFGVAFVFFIWLFRVVSPNQRQFMKQMLRDKLKRFGWNGGSAP
jgi:O-antigen/teichoic acid export membrane protein